MPSPAVWRLLETAALPPGFAWETLSAEDSGPTPLIPTASSVSATDPAVHEHVVLYMYMFMYIVVHAIVQNLLKLSLHLHVHVHVTLLLIAPYLSCS